MQQQELRTRADYFALFEKVNRPLQPFFTESCARIHYFNAGVGYGNRIAGLEGFSRLLWGAGPAMGLLDDNWKQVIISGIINGTDPKHPDYWGTLTDRDQRMVEMPAIALALLYEKHYLWRQFTCEQQEQINQWLQQIFQRQCADGNWQFFKVIVALVLKQLDCPVPTLAVEQALENIEDCYLTGGWYRDSSRGRQDYYNPFAFHYYGLLYSCLVPEDAISGVFRERAKLFAQDYLHFFAEDGANLPFGRSLTYRYAVVSFWGALIYAEVYPVSLEVMKGIIERNLNWWLERPIFDSSGILTLGYTYPQLTLTEPYNSSLSAYWSNKIFILLALPQHHPYWSAKAVPLPKLSGKHQVKAANLLIYHDHGHTVALNAGQAGPNYHTLSNEKYLKFAYSSQFGFSIPRSNQLKSEAAMDSMLGIQRSDTKVIISEQGRTQEAVGQFLVRNQVVDILCTPQMAAATWRASEEMVIRTWLTTVAQWQIRIHRLTLQTEAVVYETGFAVENAPEQAGGFELEPRGHYFIGQQGFSGIMDLSKRSLLRKPAPIECLPNTNLMTWETTALPGLEGVLPQGEHWLVTGIYAHRDKARGQLCWSKTPSVTIADGQAMIFCNGEGVSLPLE